METGAQPPARTRSERSETPATRIKKKLKETHPGVRFRVRFTPYKRDRDMVTIGWDDSTVIEAGVLKAAKTEFDGYIFGHYSPHM